MEIKLHPCEITTEEYLDFGANSSEGETIDNVIERLQTLKAQGFSTVEGYLTLSKVDIETDEQFQKRIERLHQYLEKRVQFAKDKEKIFREKADEFLTSRNELENDLNRIKEFRGV